MTQEQAGDSAAAWVAELRRRLVTEKAKRKALMAPLQVALSTTLAEITRFIDTGDLDILSSAVSCQYEADGERDKIKGAIGW